MAVLAICIPAEVRSSVNTLRVRIDLQALLCHFRVPQELQGHPDQVALDLVQVFLDVRDAAVDIVDMSLFMLSIGLGRVRWWQEFGVVFERFDLKPMSVYNGQALPHHKGTYCCHLDPHGTNL